MPSCRGFFNRESIMRQTIGISELVVNYSGSTGFGLDFLESQVGDIGTKEIEECGEILIKTIEQFKDEIDENRIAIFGASYGGYLTCWLTGHEKYG